METTITYRKDGSIRSEKACTLAEYIEMGRLEAGQLIMVGEIVHSEALGVGHTRTESFIVGNCTPYHEPSMNDGGFGWNASNPRMKKFVLEVHELQLPR